MSALTACKTRLLMVYPCRNILVELLLLRLLMLRYPTKNVSSEAHGPRMGALLEIV